MDKEGIEKQDLEIGERDVYCICGEDMVEEYLGEAKEFMAKLEGQDDKDTERIRVRLIEINDRLEDVDNEIYLSAEEMLKGIRKVHEQSGLKQEDSIIKALKGLEVCQKFQKGTEVPKVSTVKPKSFNEVITVDLKINIRNGKNILWLICSFSRFVRGVELKGKTAQEVVKAIEDEWIHVVGCPKKRIWGDNGTNKEMQALCDKWEIQFSAGPPY